MKVLVTGANGQLGKCLKDASANYPDIEFIFASREVLDIEDNDAISEAFNNQNFDFCINTAAYTNVEKAESEPQKSFSINAEAVKNLARCCTKNNTILIQISTDYVFDGEKTSPYTEEDKTNPINIYGASKLKGEQYIQKICEKYFIVRTSWLYSQYGHNFYNSILKFAKEGRNLQITTEQTGTPTNANDLTLAILKIIDSESNKYGIYHVSNSGKATWYDFAKEILTQTKRISTIKFEKTDHYRTFAVRPKYSVLNTEKYKNEFKNGILNWEFSLNYLIKTTKP